MAQLMLHKKHSLSVAGGNNKMEDTEFRADTRLCVFVPDNLSGKDFNAYCLICALMVSGNHELEVNLGGLFSFYNCIENKSFCEDHIRSLLLSYGYMLSVIKVSSINDMWSVVKIKDPLWENFLEEKLNLRNEEDSATLVEIHPVWNMDKFSKYTHNCETKNFYTYAGCCLALLTKKPIGLDVIYGRCNLINEWGSFQCIVGHHKASSCPDHSHLPSYLICRALKAELEALSPIREVLIANITKRNQCLSIWGNICRLIDHFNK